MIEETLLRVVIIFILHVPLGNCHSLNSIQYVGLYSGAIESYQVIIPKKLTKEGESHILRHRRSTPNSNEKVIYKIHLEEEPHFLVLTPNIKFLAPGLRVQRGKRSLFLPNKDCHYKGYISGEKDTSSVAISACHLGLVGYVRGRKGEFWLEPAKNQNISVGVPHLLYRRTNPHHRKRHRNRNRKRRSLNCGTREPQRKSHLFSKKAKIFRGEKILKGLNKRSRRSVSKERHVEALLVADTSMVNFHKDSDLETYLLTIMNMVSSTYQDPSIGNFINVVVVRIITLDDDVSDGLNITVNADLALENFCKWQLNRNPADDENPSHHDVAILVTRKDICSRKNVPCSTLGVANVGGMCQPERSCNINEDNGITLAHTITHELGHNFGMYHDTPQAGCEGREGPTLHVMTPNFEADTTHIAWSGCSRRDITQFLDLGNGHCLEDYPSPDEPYNYPELPPGAMYNADHQCKLQFGSTNATVCSPLEEICARLWCMVDGQCTSMLHPAATGTHCGKHKWCIKQKCETIGEKPDPIDGDWGEWSPWASCSRTCGGGIAMKQRHCDSPVPAFGGKFCVGERQKYKVCNTEPCPDGSQSFRAEQCSMYNNGESSSFKPYFEKGDPCHLFCSDGKNSLIEPFGDSVLDGTPCNFGTRDMCIGGICTKVGCDWIVDSDAFEDKCGVCRGNGSQCVTESEELINQTLHPGYTEILKIPVNARRILILEKSHFKNIIALSNMKRTTFFLNGRKENSEPGEFDAASTTGLYERRKDKEKIIIPGPIKETLLVHVLSRGKNNVTSIFYEFTTLRGKAPKEVHFEWVKEWTVCSKTCGQGSQALVAQCYDITQDAVVSDENCGKHPGNLSKACNDFPCPTRWWIGPWQPCSISCGKGKKTRTVMCVSDKNQTMALPDWECEGQKKPADTTFCSHTSSCTPVDFSSSNKHHSYAIKGRTQYEISQLEHNNYISTKSKWLLHPWEPCSSSCGPGYQRRIVICSQFSKSCEEKAKPIDVRPCITPCS